MAYVTKIDLARQSKLIKGEKATYDGSMKIGETFEVDGQVFFRGLGVTGTDKHVLLVDYTGLVHTIPLKDVGGGGTNPNPQPSGSTIFMGEYNRDITYKLGDMVTYNGSLYVWTSNATANDIAPPNPTFWTLLATAGGNGEDGKGYEVIFKAVATQGVPPTPVAPVNDPSKDQNYPLDWSEGLIPPTTDKPYVYQSKRTKVDGKWGAYSTPVLYSVFIEGGGQGVNGTNIQYIYRRFADEQNDLTIIPSTMPEREDDNYIPTNWYSPQKGVSSQFRFEYISKRVKSTGAWSEWQDPVLWATYSENGKDGKDGSQVEYIFKRVLKEEDIELLPIPPYNNIDDMVPSGWTDDPTGVNPTYRAESYSMRTKIFGQPWTQWTKPLVWSRFNVDGLDGKGSEKIYKRTTLNIRPPNPIEPQDFTVDGYVPVGQDVNGDFWTSTPSGVNEGKQFEWSCERIKTSKYDTNGVKTSIWSEFTTPTLSSHYGRNGRDGTDIEFIYRLVKVENDASVLVPPPNNPNLDDFVPVGWTDDPSGVDDVYKFEYLATREKDGDTWSGFTKPALWSKYGDDGRDGKDIEFVYIATVSNISPQKPQLGVDYTDAEYQVDDFVPSSPQQWDDNPIGITEQKPYLWWMRRLKVNDRWDTFSNPVIVGLQGLPGIGTPGDTGDTYERRYRATSDPTIPPAFNNTDRNPAGFTITPPNITIGQYLWAIEGRITSTSMLVGTWGNAYRVSPKDGTNGSNGANGKQGPFLSFRGDFNYTDGVYEVKEYYGGIDRLEVVRSQGVFYITKSDAGKFKDASATPTTGQNGKWNTFQGNFESIATGILFAELAYIENLGVRFLRTESTGQRIEINRQNNNAIELFEDGDDINAVLLIDDNIGKNPYTLKDSSGIRIGKLSGDKILMGNDFIDIRSNKQRPNSLGFTVVNRDSQMGSGDGLKTSELYVDYLNSKSITLSDNSTTPKWKGTTKTDEVETRFIDIDLYQPPSLNGERFRSGIRVIDTDGSLNTGLTGRWYLKINNGDDRYFTFKSGILTKVER